MKRVLPPLSEPSTIEHRARPLEHKGRTYVHHSGIRAGEMALDLLTRRQAIGLAAGLLLIVVLLVVNLKLTLIGLLSLIALLYLADLIFNLSLILRSLKKAPEIVVTTDEIKKANKQGKWPVYTILCPLYKEAAVLPQFIQAMKGLDYNRARLQVILLLEEDDTETIELARSMRLPSFVETVIVPDSLPRTKPKACNYGLNYAKGDYVVIFDAEDIPDPDQLKKAVLAFRRLDADVACIQSKLHFYNPHQNAITRAFTAEYSLWFSLILPGLQSIQAPIPLGGTSNHFRTDVLRSLGGWDAFNVTEDADLGMRLAKRGYHTAVVDSTTMEEANSSLRNWFWQRSRWVKGYMQTYLVHTRTSGGFAHRSLRHPDPLLFRLLVGGKVLSMLVNPIMWILTLLYIVLLPIVGPTINSVYPAPVLYVSVLSLIGGNFLYLYYYMLGAARRGHYELIRYTPLIGIYWLLMSAAAYYALYELAVSPHKWRKTKHGLHLNLTPAEPTMTIIPAKATVLAGSGEEEL